MMRAGFTCDRCLQSLRLNVRARVSNVRPGYLPGPRRKHHLASPIAGGLDSRQKSRLQPKEAQESGKRLTSSAAARPRVPAGATGPSQHLNETRTLLKPNNLFHPFSKSPSPAIRQRAEFIKQNAFCPHPSHQQTRLPDSPHDPEARKDPHGALPPAHSHFECPDCGVPIYCSEEHWMDDFEAHLEVCDTIRQINEDDHDLHSGRFFPEFSYPGPQDDNFVINMTNWDTFLYTREFLAINDDRSMRQVTRMLTYPITVGSVLHELSPYNIKKGGRLTVEGLKSMAGGFRGYLLLL